LRKRGAYRSVLDLTASIRSWITDCDHDSRPFVWHKTAGEILDSLAAYCQRSGLAAHYPAGNPNVTVAVG
jgi:hypothetical protein